MNDLFRFTLIGTSSGSLYVLAALGLVVVRRGSGVVNFAQGAMSMVAAYVYWELQSGRGWPWFPAAIVGVLSAAGIGVLTYWLVMRPLRDASSLTKLIATLGVMGLLQAGAALRYPEQVVVVRPFLPVGTVRIFGATIGQDRVIIFSFVLVLTVILWSVYRFTTFGLATTACSENRRAASALGISPHVIGASNWAIGAALGGIAGILLVPIAGLGVTQLTLLVIPTLAAGVIGGLSSFALTLAGGIGIGVVQALLTRYTSDLEGWVHHDLTGLATAVPFIAMAAVLIARGASIPGKGERAAQLPSLGVGRIRPSLIGGVVVVTLLFVWILLPTTWVDALIVQATLAIVILSVVVVTGYAGQVSLAQFAFAGLGAMIAGRLIADHDAPFALAALAAALLVIPIGVVVGLAGVRTRGVNLAIVTLGFAVALETMFFNNIHYTGGHNGTVIGSARFFGVDFGSIAHPKRYATLCVLVLALASMGIANLRRGRVGRRLIAVRCNERAASALGISVVGAKLYAFALSAVIAAIGGVLIAFRFPTIQFESSFGVFRSVQVVQDGVVGGVGWIAGAPVGAGLEPGTTGSRLLDLIGGGATKYLFLIGSALLLLTVLHAPDGIASLNHKQGGRIARRLPRRRRTEPTQATAAVSRGSVPPVVLEVHDLGVRFGGVVALTGLSVRVAPGQVVGLIGPNGAGKTTAIECITGFVAPAAGRVFLDGVDITDWSRERRARAGLGRSFQSLELFDDLTLRENIQAASEQRDRMAYFTDLVRPGEPYMSPEGYDAIREFGLLGDLDHKPSELSYGRRRLAAIARAVAAAPSVLLLDEPAAGLDDRETAELGHLVRRLADEWRMAILLIEHDVEMVMRTCDFIHALEFGRPIGSGTPAEVRANEAVIAAYLGAGAAVGNSVELQAPTPAGA